MLLYVKLILKSLLRHQKSGKKLFVFISLCMVTIIILLTMMDSFYVKYLDEIINNWTSHIRIVSKNSPKLKPNSAFSVEEENLSLIKIDSKIEQFISNMPEVQAYSPVIETYGNFFTIKFSCMLVLLLRIILFSFFCNCFFT